MIIKHDEIVGYKDDTGTEIFCLECAGDDFEDGDYLGWSYSNTAGSADTDVILNGGLGGSPENHVAWVYHRGSGKKIRGL